MNRFYITTPLYYVNDKPHLGTAYATVNTDTLARYHRLFGDEVRFLTGTDEHGQKVQQTAEKRGKTPQEHCDELSAVFQSAWKNLGVEYDIFFRTTDKFHMAAVQKTLQHLFDKGDIYADTYEGWYSVSEEIFYTEKDLVNGKTPSGNDVVKVNEKNYFFKMSKYQQALINHIENNPGFIQPDNRRNETLGFLRQPLADLCISRPKSRLNWGIEIPFDKDYVTYVWFDALLNYATAMGFNQPDRQTEFETWWQQAGAHHMIGKDILITHTVYWTTMLLACDVKLPKKVFATGWLLNKDSEKMSKSRGSVMDPIEMTKLVGVEPLRYFLVREFRLGQDGPASHELIVSRVNTDLANNLGNLLSRTTNLISKFYEGQPPSMALLDAAGEKIKSQLLALPAKVEAFVRDFAPSQALDEVVLVLNETNKYLEDTSPWKTAKTDLTAAAAPLALALETLRFVGTLLWPVMPNKMTDLLDTIGAIKPNATTGANNFYEVWQSLKEWDKKQTGRAVRKADPLFPRIELND